MSGRRLNSAASSEQRRSCVVTPRLLGRCVRWEISNRSVVRLYIYLLDLCRTNTGLLAIGSTGRCADTNDVTGPCQ